MSTELLVACPLCKQPGFTTRGLRQHWCPAKPPAPGHTLTKAEWQAAVDAARELRQKIVEYHSIEKSYAGGRK